MIDRKCAEDNSSNFTEEEMWMSNEQNCPISLTKRQITKIISLLELDYHLTLSVWQF